MGCATTGTIGQPHHTPMAIKVGVMGGAEPVRSKDHLDKAHRLGRAIAGNGCILITGACPGLPLAAACGAKHAGGTVVGVSPAVGLNEHVTKYQSPTEFHDVLIFTGSGFMGREVINIRSSDIVVIVGGRSGTLGELAIAYDEGKLIGVLTGTGGISNLVADILAVCAKETGTQVIYEGDPETLIDRLLEAYRAIAAAPAGCGDANRPVGDRADSELGLVVDPVCGMRILPAAAAAERTVRDIRYWFCSTACADVFDSAPGAVVIGEGISHSQSPAPVTPTG
jgi:uncharacterized protein (TIGR00725 family)